LLEQGKSIPDYRSDEAHVRLIVPLVPDPDLLVNSRGQVYRLVKTLVEKGNGPNRGQRKGAYIIPTNARL
jgi:hypothetical protein